MKDGIILGTGNSRTLKSGIGESTTWSNFLSMLRAGTLPIDLGGIVSEGWQQLGTPLNRSTLLSDSTAAALGMLKADPTVDDALALIARLLYGEKYPVIVRATEAGGPPIVGLKIPGLKTSDGSEDVVTDSEGVAHGFSDTSSVYIKLDCIDIEGEASGTVSKGIPLVLDLELDLHPAAFLRSTSSVKIGYAKTVTIHLAGGGGGGGGGSYAGGAGGSGGEGGIDGVAEVVSAGGSTGDSGVTAGGGGGNGSSVRTVTGIDVSSQHFTQIPVVIGAGGSGGAAGTQDSPNGQNGAKGGVTSFLGYKSSATSTRLGGDGATYGNPGAAGSASNSTFVNPLTGKTQSVGGGGGGGGSYDSGQYGLGGTGGNPSGANGGKAGEPGKNAAANTGGGGGGGGGNAAGGNGGSGFVYVEFNF